MYKSFIITLLATTSILFSFYSIFVLNYKILYMDYEYPMWLQVKETINSKNNDKISLLIIGDSRAKAGFIPNEIHESKSLNLSLGGATPVEGYYTLLNFLKNNPVPDNIILSYTAYHFRSRSPNWKRTVAYNFLNDVDNKDIELKAIQYSKESFIKTNKSYINYKNPSIYFDSFKNGILDERWNKNHKMYKECNASRGHHYYGTSDFSKDLNTETKKNKFKVSKFQDYYFRNLIKLAKKHHIKTHFFIVPFNRASYEIVNKKYIKDYFHYLKKISKKYNMKMCNKQTFLENDQFGDSSHLFNGARPNTRKMYQCTR